jgi:hypothetical protein
VSAGVRLGVLEGVRVAVRGADAGTVGRVVKGHVELGVGLATVGETWETARGVGLAQQPARALAIMISSKHRANARTLGLAPGRCEACLSCWFDGRDGTLVILSL